MSLTTDPRTVTSGRVAVSLTSKVKHDALLGRTALRTLVDGTRVRGVIDGFDGWMPRMTITAVVGDGEQAIVGRWCRLDSVVELVDATTEQAEPEPGPAARFVTVVATVAVPDDDRWDTRIARAVGDALAAAGAAPVPCDWAPDPDTIADAVGATYGTVSVVDLNPGR